VALAVIDRLDMIDVHQQGREGFTETQGSLGEASEQGIDRRAVELAGKPIGGGQEFQTPLVITDREIGQPQHHQVDQRCAQQAVEQGGQIGKDAGAMLESRLRRPASLNRTAPL
jgi:hypothetical protein